MDYLTPAWRNDGAHTPHDWHNYVSDEVRSLWHTFTDEQKLALGKCFEEIASREEWD